MKKQQRKHSVSQIAKWMLDIFKVGIPKDVLDEFSEVETEGALWRMLYVLNEHSPYNIPGRLLSSDFVFDPFPVRASVLRPTKSSVLVKSAMELIESSGYNTCNFVAFDSTLVGKESIFLVNATALPIDSSLRMPTPVCSSLATGAIVIPYDDEPHRLYFVAQQLSTYVPS